VAKLKVEDGGPNPLAKFPWLQAMLEAHKIAGVAFNPDLQAR